MENCSFCGHPVRFGTGKMFVKKDAKILWFCSRRCEKNLLKLKRSPRDYGFTAAYAFAKRQHLAELAHVAGGGLAAEKPKKASAPAKKAVKKAAAPAAVVKAEAEE